MNDDLLAHIDSEMKNSMETTFVRYYHVSVSLRGILKILYEDSGWISQCITARFLFLLSSGDLTGCMLLGCCCDYCIANALGNAVQGTRRPYRVLRSIAVKYN